MFKRIRKVVLMTLALVMLCTTAFTTKVSAAPAPAVSNVYIEGGYIDNNGDVIIQVYVVGYGHNEIARWDGIDATLEDEDYIDGVDRVVYAFRQYWNCGQATIGTHTFTYRTTSINSPWNTVSRSTSFTIS